jgi:hypothetical protein
MSQSQLWFVPGRHQTSLERAAYSVLRREGTGLFHTAVEAFAMGWVMLRSTLVYSRHRYRTTCSVVGNRDLIYGPLSRQGLGFVIS